MKYLITLLFLFVFFSAIAQRKDKLRSYNLKRFSKDNYFYRFTDRPEPGQKPRLEIIYPTRPFWGMLKDDGSVIVVKPDIHDTTNLHWRDTLYISVQSPSGTLESYIGKIYFPEIFYPKSNIVDSVQNRLPGVYKKLDRVKYFDYKFILQAMSVPLKYRKAIDTIPYTTETGVNVAFGVGIKEALNWYNLNKSFLGQKTNSLSFTQGLLFGLGGADVKGKVTAPAGFKDRKEPIFSWGGFFMIGFNNINIGFVLGEDIALKQGGKAGGWIYNSKIWKGIAVGLDIIK